MVGRSGKHGKTEGSEDHLGDWSTRKRRTSRWGNQGSLVIRGLIRGDKRQQISWLYYNVCLDVDNRLKGKDSAGTGISECRTTKSFEKRSGARGISEHRTENETFPFFLVQTFPKIQNISLGARET